MIKKKICMLGSFAVGKTSLVQQFVLSIFSEKYHTTIGVKIDQKIVRLDHQDINLLVWDIHGEDIYQKVKPAYLIGASGYFIVVDGLRKKTLETGLELHDMAQKVLGNVPCLVLINKSDLIDQWEITDEDCNELKKKEIPFIITSAKNNSMVEEAFEQLSKLMLK